MVVTRGRAGKQSLCFRRNESWRWTVVTAIDHWTVYLEGQKR